MSAFCYILAGAFNILWLVLRDRLSIWVQMSVPVITVGLLAIGAVFAAARLPRKAGKRYVYRMLWVVLLYYLAILSAMLFFGGLFHLDRVWGGAVNLEPFHTIRNFLRHYLRTGSLSSLFNLLGNAAILVPLGVLLPLMFRPMRRFWVFLPFAALVAAGIEYLQWVTALGVADVDDSILNFAGAAAGYLVTRLCQMIYFGIEKRKQRE